MLEFPLIKVPKENLIYNYLPLMFLTVQKSKRLYIMINSNRIPCPLYIKGRKIYEKKTNPLKKT